MTWVTGKFLFLSSSYKDACQKLKSLGMSILGYGQWKGRQNLNLLIDDYQQKVTIFTKKVESK